MTSKKCNGKCQQILPIDNFGKRTYKNGTVGYRSFCKKCNNIARDEWRQKNKDQDNARNKEYNSKNFINIRSHKLTKYWPNTTPKEAYKKYMELMEKQNYSCGVCKKKDSRVSFNNKNWSLAVDHDHETGQIRGLLCNSCNRGLGLLGDTLQTLENAVNYLKEPIMKKEDIQKEWVGMPEFIQEDLTPYRVINVRFRNEEDVKKFEELMNQTITPKQKALWFPEMPLRRSSHLRYSKDET